MKGERSSGAWRRRRRRWSFANATFDEGAWALLVDGRPVPIEAKPAELLLELLLRPGETLSKDELLDAVWPGLTVVEASLTVAISKLRKSLRDADGKIVETVPRIGYRLGVAVSVESLDTPLAPRFAFAPGDPVPGRPQWLLQSALGGSGAADVWRARHLKTGETRIFKFADAPDRLRDLKREVALSRFLISTIGPEGCHAPVREWNFSEPPYFIEFVDGGSSLADWCDAAGGVAAIPLERRLAIGLAIVRALAQIHGVGVLHKDLKPANILIEECADTTGAGAGTFRIRLADFGSGELLDIAKFDAYGITALPFEEVALSGSADGGTFGYRAPELLAGGAPTAKSDIWAAGLVLFQLVTGDFRRGLAPGWEETIADPLLCEDIAAACAGDPASRLSSAAELEQRLIRRPERRIEAEQRIAESARLVALQAAENRRAARKPWVVIAAASGIAGLIGTSVAAGVAWHQRNDALHQSAMTEASYRFLADDLLARTDPRQADQAAETLASAAQRASGEIDRRFAADPLLAARLHGTLARAFHFRSEWDTARASYGKAEAAFRRAKAENSPAAVQNRLRLAQMEAFSGQKDGLDRARAILLKEKPAIVAQPRSANAFYFAQAEGTVGFFSDIKTAEQAFRTAATIAIDNADISPQDAIKARQQHAIVLMRLGRPDEAEPILTRVTADMEALRGADDPDTLLARQNLITASVMQGRADEAVKQANGLLPRFDVRFGPDHRYTLALLSTRYEGLALLDRYDEAARDAERVWRAASAREGPDSHQSLVGQLDLAAVQCRSSDPAAGLSSMRDAMQRLTVTFGQDYPLTSMGRFVTAECLLANGRNEEAVGYLTRIDRSKVRALLGNADWGPEADLALAEAALARNDHRQAQSLLTAARPYFERDRADPYQRRRLAALLAKIQERSPA